MSRVDFVRIADLFKGNFIVSPEAMQERLFKVKAYVFDWDGIFNNGMKDEHGCSPFSEVDAMGTNLLRFNHCLRKGQNPVAAVITGEKNNTTFALAEREHFNAVYFGIKYKKEALVHLCAKYDMEPHEVVFVFDDVLDFSAAEHCGLRIMVGRKCNPLLTEYAVKHNLVDYITANDGGNHALRECTELLTGISERYDDTITERLNYSDVYLNYLKLRNAQNAAYYTKTGDSITETSPK